MSLAAEGTRSMVVSPHYLASEAGSVILERGGNAFDAAVAVSACLAVVYPHMTGLGGDSFWLLHDGGEGKVAAYNASGRSGAGVSRSLFEGEERIPVRGARSAITVPGMVDGWDAVLRRYGRLTLGEVLEPAIRHAENGFPLSRDQHATTLERLELLRGMPVTRDIYVPGGRVPAAGERFTQKLLGRSLRKLAETGRDGFYQGELARNVTGYLEKNGGLLTMEDFAGHRGEWVEPLMGSYRGLELYQLPPNSQGFTGIMVPHILEHFDFRAIRHGSYEYYHLLVEALKLAFADRNRVLTDPDFADIPVKRLISKAYCRELAEAIDPMGSRPFDSVSLGSDTAYAAVVDEEGNAASFIQSLYFEFGSAVTAGDTGILLQNRGSFFSLDPGHVNRLEPRKRTFHTLMPAMACREGKPYLLYGTQGGEGQPQTQAALLTRMVDYGMNPQEAVSAPRWVWGRTWGEETQELKVESRVEPEVLEALSRAGHRVKPVAPFDGVVGHAHAIKISGAGRLEGGTDPRCDGAAVGR
ncbi:gamma-glutamyltransferase [Gorillibacterium sp. sgz5001074]|uniref:gamma-glutamyltransferase n=1 Tax=Gorillibacterium sp. sgz5001074 TaxID=3446695 RepID=UPI003F674BD6